MNIKKPSALFLDKASLYPGDLDFSILEEEASWHWFDNADPADITAKPGKRGDPGHQ